MFDSMTHYRAGFVAGTTASVDDDSETASMDYAHDAVQAPDDDLSGDEFDHACLIAFARVERAAELWRQGYRAGLASGIRFIG
jgi:hypothetical protein